MIEVIEESDWDWRCLVCQRSVVGEDVYCHIRVENRMIALCCPLNPNLRISEIAFEVGFQSLSQFNRSFRCVAGVSPKEYRNSNALSSATRQI